MHIQTMNRMSRRLRTQALSQSNGAALELNVELLKVRPKVWRRIVVSPEISLDQLHQVLQVAMGWQNRHMHEFSFGDRTYGIPYPDDIDLAVDHAQKITLGEAVAGLESFAYRYDFGDGWEHRVRIGPASAAEPGTLAICLAGQNACPPEDVGGADGYRHFVGAIADPKHKEHASLLRWHGGTFDPAAFDLAATNVALIAALSRR